VLVYMRYMSGSVTALTPPGFWRVLAGFGGCWRVLAGWMGPVMHTPAQAQHRKIKKIREALFEPGSNTPKRLR